MNRLWKILPLGLGIITIVIYAAYSYSRHGAIQAKFSIPFCRVYDYNNILVTYIADGDTVKLEDGSWLRLVGIDAPEYHDSDKLFNDARRTRQDVATITKMGGLSKAFAKELLENKRVRLEFGIEKHDKYNRLLAYVFLEDGTFVNAKIIESGYAKTMTIPPNVKYADLLVKLESEAKAGKKGLWGLGY